MYLASVTHFALPHVAIRFCSVTLMFRLSYHTCLPVPILQCKRKYTERRRRFPRARCQAFHSSLNEPHEGIQLRRHLIKPVDEAFVWRGHGRLTQRERWLRGACLERVCVQLRVAVGAVTGFKKVRREPDHVSLLPFGAAAAVSFHHDNRVPRDVMRRVSGEGNEAVAEVYRHVEDGDDRALEGSCLCYVVNASDGALLYSTHISL